MEMMAYFRNAFLKNIRVDIKNMAIPRLIIPPLDADIRRETAITIPAKKRKMVFACEDSGEKSLIIFWTKLFRPPKPEASLLLFCF